MTGRLLPLLNLRDSRRPEVTAQPSSDTEAATGMNFGGPTEALASVGETPTTGQHTIDPRTSRPGAVPAEAPVNADQSTGSLVSRSIPTNLAELPLLRKPMLPPSDQRPEDHSIIQRIAVELESLQNDFENKDIDYDQFMEKARNIESQLFEAFDRDAILAEASYLCLMDDVGLQWKQAELRAKPRAPMRIFGAALQDIRGGGLSVEEVVDKYVELNRLDIEEIQSQAAIRESAPGPSVSRASEAAVLRARPSTLAAALHDIRHGRPVWGAIEAYNLIHHDDLKALQKAAQESIRI
jgi:hypothetical protein